MKDRITLGINMYKEDFEYDYILELLKKYGFKGVRVSITVPNCEGIKRNQAIADFVRIKPRMFEFFKKLSQNGISPHYDCNKIPVCCLTKKEIAFAQELFKNEHDINKRDVNFVRCNPVIDILQDLTAIRCFGLSQYTKQDIRKYHNIEELRAYYRRTIDAFACNTIHSEACAACEVRSVDKCYGGCLAYKMDDILKLQAVCNELMRESYGEGN